MAIHLSTMVQVRSLVLLQNVNSVAPFSVWVEGENQSGNPAVWSICDPCVDGFLDLNDVETAGAGLKINKIEFRGGATDTTRSLILCEVFAFEGQNISQGSTALATPPSTQGRLPFLVEDSASLNNLFGPKLKVQLIRVDLPEHYYF